MDIKKTGGKYGKMQQKTLTSICLLEYHLVRFFSLFPTPLIHFFRPNLKNERHNKKQSSEKLSTAIVSGWSGRLTYA